MRTVERCLKAMAQVDVDIVERQQRRSEGTSEHQDDDTDEAQHCEAVAHEAAQAAIARPCRYHAECRGTHRIRILGSATKYSMSARKLPSSTSTAVNISKPITMG